MVLSGVFTSTQVSLRLGDPISGLRILHHGLLDFSEEVAKCLLDSGYEVRGNFLWEVDVVCLASREDG